MSLNKKNNKKISIEKSQLCLENDILRKRIIEKSKEIKKYDVKPLTKEKARIYILMLFLPPIGLYEVLKIDSPFNSSEKIMQLMVGIVYIFSLLNILWLNVI